MTMTRTPESPAEEHRRELLVLWLERRDERARDELVREYLGLVRALARRYAGGNEPLEDLVQVGSIGLVKALDRFDPERGDFAAYAVPTIVGELKRHFRDRTWTVAVPRSVKDLSVSVSKQLDLLSNELGRSPTIAELAREVGADEEDVVEALEATRAQTVKPLVTAAEDDGELLGPATTFAVEETGFAEVHNRSLLADGLRALDARERQIVELRFAGQLTQSQIAREVGISQMHVSRLLRTALEKMRASIDAEDAR
jgi:RNA polymerase sigma-B factor